MTPVTRWLVNPADETAGRKGGQQVGRADLDELREAADDARRWDSKHGGGNWKANSVTDCLDHRAGPLLQGSFSDEIGRELFSVTAELSRLAGWTAFDVGQHDAAQRHFIQALRLARAGGDVQLGCYVLTTMAMQTLMRGFASQAVDMTQGAFERARGHRKAAPVRGICENGRPDAGTGLHGAASRLGRPRIAQMGPGDAELEEGEQGARPLT